MKRFTILATVVLTMVLLTGAAGAADFSGQWVAFKMSMPMFGELQVVDVSDDPVESRGRVEFKDGKVFFMANAKDEAGDGMAYTASGDKLVATMAADDAKAMGCSESIEFSIEGGELVMTMFLVDGAGELKTFFQKR